MIGFIGGLLGFGIRNRDSHPARGRAPCHRGEPQTPTPMFGGPPLRQSAAPTRYQSTYFPQVWRTGTRPTAPASSGVAVSERRCASFGARRRRPIRFGLLRLDGDLGVDRVVDPDLGDRERRRLAAEVEVRLHGRVEPELGRGDVQRAAAVVLERDQPAAGLGDLEPHGRPAPRRSAVSDGRPSVRLGDHRLGVPDERGALALRHRPLLGIGAVEHGARRGALVERPALAGAARCSRRGRSRCVRFDLAEARRDARCGPAGRREDVAEAVERRREDGVDVELLAPALALLEARPRVLDVVEVGDDPGDFAGAAKLPADEVVAAEEEHRLVLHQRAGSDSSCDACESGPTGRVADDEEARPGGGDDEDDAERQRRRRGRRASRGARSRSRPARGSRAPWRRCRGC